MCIREEKEKTPYPVSLDYSVHKRGKRKDTISCVLWLYSVYERGTKKRHHFLCPLITVCIWEEKEKTLYPVYSDYSVYKRGKRKDTISVSSDYSMYKRGKRKDTISCVLRLQCVQERYKENTRFWPQSLGCIREVLSVYIRNNKQQLYSHLRWKYIFLYKEY